MKDQEDADMAEVDKALNVLGEHFDSVQILCTRYKGGDDGGTVNISRGTGNWFARYGQMKEWLIREEETLRMSRRTPPEKEL